jgi:hypothetical protein
MSTRRPRTGRRQERGVLFVEMLFVISGLAFLLLLVMWVAHYNASRSEYQGRVARCAMAIATSPCGVTPAACGGVASADRGYGGGADAGDKILAGGQSALVFSGTIPRPGVLGSPAPYMSSVSTVCRRPDGKFNELAVVLQVAGS